MQDYVQNGLIVYANEKISKILFSTSLTLPLIEYAVKYEFDCIIVHHGIFDNPLGKKLQLLYKNNINLFSYHLPLDAHHIFGNNISLLKYAQLQLEDWDDISAIAKNNNQLTISQIAQNINNEISKTSNYQLQSIKQTFTQQQIEDKLNIFMPRVEYGSNIYDYTNNKASKIFICSGGSDQFLMRAVELGCDLMILGEMKEYTVPLAQEYGISILQLGHHRSETTGIQQLMNIIQQNNSDVKCQFVAFDNIQ